MKKDNYDDSSIYKVFETEWFSIDAIPCNLDKKPYYRLSCDDSVCIIAKTIDKKIILIDQYRPAIGHFTLEFPSGYVKDGESIRDAINRELIEETGFVCRSITYMGPLKISPSRINNTLHVFFGEDAVPIDTNKKIIDDDIKLILVTNEEFKSLIIKQKYTEIGGMAIFLLAKLKGYL